MLCMPGVKIEAWRAKKGPAQCHRCQKFRHSSHNCHRQIACVRCGEAHAASECKQPKETPATCANCGGPHPANNASCPAFKRQARNRKAGPTATTRPPKGVSKNPPAPTTVEPVPLGEQTGASLMAVANMPKAAAAATQGKKKKPKKKKKQTQPPNEEPTTAQPDSRAATAAKDEQPPENTRRIPRQARHDSPRQKEEVAVLVKIMIDVLNAVLNDESPVTAVVQGLSKILELHNG
ncbi:unnamed protein product [Colias eurytheme]|nr:unnamed protein product [Colias eurytheme]